MTKNYFMEVAKMMLQDSGWESGNPILGSDINTMFKIEGGSKKQVNLVGSDARFFFQDTSIFTCSINDMLKRTNSLLNYFIEE